MCNETAIGITRLRDVELAPAAAQCCRRLKRLRGLVDERSEEAWVEQRSDYR